MSSRCVDGWEKEGGREGKGTVEWDARKEKGKGLAGHCFISTQRPAAQKWRSPHQLSQIG